MEIRIFWVHGVLNMGSFSMDANLAIAKLRYISILSLSHSLTHSLTQEESSSVRESLSFFGVAQLSCASFQCLEPHNFCYLLVKVGKGFAHFKTKTKRLLGSLSFYFI